MKLIVDSDWTVGAVLTHADSANGGKSFAGHNRSRERGEFVFLKDRLQE